MTPTKLDHDEYVTIIAPSAVEAMAQFTQRGLAAQGYSIHAKIDRHRFALIQGSESQELFEGEGMYAATFRRTVSS